MKSPPHHVASLQQPPNPMTLPTTIVDCHHHFLAPSEPFHAFINALGAPAHTEFEYSRWITP